MNAPKPSFTAIAARKRSRGLSLALAAMLLGGAFACAPAQKTASNDTAATGALEASVSAPILIATAAPTATPSPTPAATPAPSPTPLPTSAISDAWYIQRTADLRGYLELYGGYTGDALEARVSAMEIQPDRPMIALTFDDGPVAGITDEIVRILAKYDCRATFFIRGGRMNAEATVGLLKQILGEGNELGNHTWGHEILSRANDKVIMNTLRYTNQAVEKATGYTMHSMRPPGGYSSASVRRYARKYGLAVVLWAQSGNVHEQDPEKIAENVRRQIVNGKELEDGDIVLLHDTKPWMVDAVKIMVPQLLQDGYQLVTVQELLHLSERGFVPGAVYHRQNEPEK